MTSDPRMGLPSASKAEKYTNCQAAWYYERSLPPLPPGPDAEFGTMVHDFLAGKYSPEQVPEEVREAAAQCTHWEEEAIRRVREAVPEIADNIPAVFREEREYLSLTQGGAPAMSGQADVTYSWGNGVYLRLDYKTGRVPVAQADANVQLRWLAVLMLTSGFDRRWAPRVFVGIIQPYAKEPLTLAEFGLEELRAAKTEVMGVLASLLASGPDSPQNVGPWCKYCPANGTACAASRATLAIATVQNLDIVDGAQLGTLLDRCALAEEVMERIKGEAKRRLSANPDAIAGYRLKPGHNRETITDTLTVWQRAKDIGVGQADFLGCVTVKKGALERAVKLATGVKGKGLDLQMVGLLDGCVETKVTAPSLEKV